MSRPGTRLGLAALALVLVASPLAAQHGDPAADKNGIWNDWKALYPASDSDDNVLLGTGKGCQLCHRDSSGGNPWNAYGWRIRDAIQSGSSETEAILLAAGLDSDADPTGATNGEEIAADTQPGWTPGPSNTIFFADGGTDLAQPPPAAILGALDPGVADPWTDLGSGKPGTGGIVPALAGSGPMTGGSSNQVDLTDALPGTTTNLVVGLTAIDAPFKGGTLVPAPDFLLAGLPVDGSGNFSLPFTWPAGVPAGTLVYWQHWVVDGAASGNLSASNALESTTG